jgi:hypothetical protein
VQRALRIADALLKALQAKGYGFSPGSSDPINIGRSECSAILFGKFRVPFSIYEKYNHEKHTPTQFELENRDFIRPDKVDYRLSGILVFKIKLDSHSAPDYKKEWKDLPSRQLEDAIDEIVEGLIMAGTEFQNRCEEWARRAGELREQQDQQARAAHLEHLRKAGTADLEAQAHAWHRARVIRAFVAEVERLALASGGTLPTEIAQWLTWAKDQADRLDPLTHDIDAVIRGAKASA